MKKLIIAGMAFGLAVGGQATIFTYTAALNGFQETPGTGSQAIGTIILQLDDVAQTASGTGSLQFMFNTITDFHIHEAPFGTAGPVRIPIGAGAFSNMGGGNYNINFNVGLPVNGVSFTQLKTFLDARNGYFNVHSNVFPGGEIRGQITPVPEPATLAVVGAGVAAVLRRRRRK